MANTDRAQFEDSIPSAKQVDLDVLEWWCQVILQDCSSAELYGKRVDGFMSVLEDLGENLKDYGRVFNRTQLAVLFSDLTNRPLVPDEEEENDDDAAEALALLPSDAWAEYQDELKGIRSKLLRKDADYNEDADKDKTVDDVLESSPKFAEDYEAVMTLLKLHEIAAAFQSTLKKLQRSRAQKTMLTKVESAVDEYKEAIKKLELDEETTEALTSFLLADLYKKKVKDLPHELHQHAADILQNDDNDFSYSQVRHKVCRLLQRWAAVLSVPTLCRLGYGGFAKRRKSSICVDDNVSVSSWGIDEEELQERKQIEGDSAPGGSGRSEDSIEGYATAQDDEPTKGDDETADAEDVQTAFDFSTQPPFPDADSLEEDMQVDSEMKGEEENDGHKKPRAKRKKNQQEEMNSDVETPKAQGASFPRRSSPRRSSRLANASPSPSPSSRRKRSTRTGAASSGIASASTKRGDDNSIPSTAVSPTRKTRSAGARKPHAAAADDDDDNIPSPESSRRPAKAAARYPSPFDEKDEEDSESAPNRARDPARAVAPRRPPPPRPRESHGRRAKKPTVIEWTDSEPETETESRPAKRPRSSLSSGSGKKAKKQKPRRPYTAEEMEAIRAGVQRFGEGKWTWIRANSNGILLSRSNVDIKDKYRNMKNRGEG